MNEIDEKAFQHALCCHIPGRTHCMENSSAARKFLELYLEAARSKAGQPDSSLPPFKMGVRANHAEYESVEEWNNAARPKPAQPSAEVVKRVALAIGAARIAGGGNPLNDTASEKEALAAIAALQAVGRV